MQELLAKFVTTAEEKEGVGCDLRLFLWFENLLTEKIDKQNLQIFLIKNFFRFPPISNSAWRHRQGTKVNFFSDIENYKKKILQWFVKTRKFKSILEKKNQYTRSM
jgi:hypothetical protein